MKPRTTGRRGRAALLPLVLVLVHATAAAGFDDDFTGATLRVDVHHFGTAGDERVALDRMRIEGPWPGSREGLVDGADLGAYRVELVDRATWRVLYARGFSSLYGEWETTAPARAGAWSVFEEAVRVPEPRRRAVIRIHERDDDGAFRELWTAPFDPGSRFVDRAPVPAGDVTDLAVHGPPATRVDLAILGDGYADREAFLADARRAAGYLFAEEPYRSRREDFNVRAVFTPSPAAGVSQPRAGRFVETPLGVRYNTFDSERYVMTRRDRAWRDAAAAAPYDAVLILFPDRQYGGGGIFGQYSTASMGSAFADYLVVHEFGHHFAGLGDEYYTADVAYESAPPAVEPWEPNVTALLDGAAPPWSDLLAEGTPVPTPWRKEAYEGRSRAIQDRRRDLRAAGAAEKDLEALFEAEREQLEAFFAEEEHASVVGAFEGAGYRARGLYRPQADCLMFTRDRVGFCRVCRRAIEAAIDRETR